MLYYIYIYEDVGRGIARRTGDAHEVVLDPTLDRRGTQRTGHAVWDPTYRAHMDMLCYARHDCMMYVIFGISHSAGADCYYFTLFTGGASGSGTGGA